ncbi:MAG: peptidyl-prolyl cis-trans isomerase [Desulfatibacillaceae bacterium]
MKTKPGRPAGLQRALVVVALAVVLAGSLLSSARAEMVDRIIAVVNSDIIMYSELQSVMDPYLERLQAAGYSWEMEEQLREKLREEMLNELIERKLADQEIERLGVSVDEAEVDAAEERLKQERGWTQEDLETALEREGLSLEKYREELRSQLLRAKLVQRAVNSRIVLTDEDVRRYYEEHPEKFSGEETYHLQNLVVEYGDDADEAERMLARSRLARVGGMVNSGFPFAELQKRLEFAKIAARGGDLGFFTLEELTPKLQEAVKKLESGQCSEPIEADKGYQIIWLKEVRDSGGTTLEDASPEIRRELYTETVNKRYSEWVSELKEKSFIQIKR